MHFAVFTTCKCLSSLDRGTLEHTGLPVAVEVTRKPEPSSLHGPQWSVSEALLPGRFSCLQ